VNYYPDYVLTNQNLNTVNVPSPSLQYQRLTLNNLGILDNNVWFDYGQSVFAGYSAFAIDNNGYIWLAKQGGGYIEIWDISIQNPLYSFSVGGIVNCFYLANGGGYMFIGGKFDSINGNPIQQYNIARIIIIGTLYAEDPMYDGGGKFGTQIGSEVYCIHDRGGTLMLGGNFTTTYDGSQANYIVDISNPYGSGGQNMSEFQGGMDGKVFTIYWSSSNNYIFVGGEFLYSGVNFAGVYTPYISYNDGINWFPVGGGVFNNAVYTIQPCVLSPYLFITGAFSALFLGAQDYSIYIDSTFPTNVSETNLNLGVGVPNYKQGFFNGMANVAIGFNNEFWYSSSYQNWVSYGQAGAGENGINYWLGDWKVIGEYVQYVRSHTLLPDSCAFLGYYKYNGVYYTTYTITTTNVSQQFLGDYASGSWSIIGQGVGAFS